MGLATELHTEVISPKKWDQKVSLRLKNEQNPPLRGQKHQSRPQLQEALDLLGWEKTGREAKVEKGEKEGERNSQR